MFCSILDYDHIAGFFHHQRDYEDRNLWFAVCSYSDTSKLQTASRIQQIKVYDSPILYRANQYYLTPVHFKPPSPRYRVLDEPCVFLTTEKNAFMQEFADFEPCCDTHERIFASETNSGLSEHFALKKKIYNYNFIEQ